MENNRGTPRILHVFASLNRGGAETWLMDVMRSTSREEFHIDVCVNRHAKGAYEEEFESLGGSIFRCPLNKNVLLFTNCFKRLLLSEHYDIVHSHLYYFSGLILWLAAKAGVPKRIAHIHPAEDHKAGGSFRSLYTWWMKRWIKRYGTNFLGPSQASLEGFWGSGWQEDPTKHVIYNGIRTDRFVQPVDRFQIRRKLGIPENAPLVLNVSRFSAHKRHEFLVQVAERVLTQKQDVYFLLIGNGTLKKKIEELVHSKGLADRFLFISGRPSIDCYWLAADVFAFPSCNEGFGIVVIEAALAGLKIIVQDIPGVREAATVCPDPIMLPLDTTPDEWAETMLNVLSEPRTHESDRQVFLKEFPLTIENSVAKLREIYGDLSNSVRVDIKHE